MENGFEPGMSNFRHEDVSPLDLGLGHFGCSHYRRRCKIRAPCCDEIFDCRHCHNESKVICSLCGTEQDVQQHCIQCGVCMGNYFCSKCNFCDDDGSKTLTGCCSSILLKDSHNCVERAMDHNCPVCFERYACLVCSKSYCAMSRVWEKLDQEVASTPMPQMYQNKMVWILCNDCGETSEVIFHIVAQKCLRCNSYNTRQTQGGPTSCSSGFEEMVR
ncbi:hypothetical protein P3X46_009641 [Hevea brasiliensis]|uniref:CHY-type domain-containing protein n=1 Tax=Hevea brasiliensis TaxID=3981 RepID=A0ABQ9MNK0_HEVBR|nr:hypothetical protein P3X46_009641 [Hevea brasiliensis]